MDSLLDQAGPVEKLARDGGMSRSQLLRRFRQELGDTPRALLKRKRLEKARALLTNTDLTVKQVARTVGYRSAQHLANQFRTHFGITPTECRAH